MSPFTAFSNGKSALRRGAIALATVATLFAANAEAAITPRQCSVIQHVMKDALETLGTQGLSQPFMTSLFRFIAPDGTNATCATPAKIVTLNEYDSAMYGMIRSTVGRPPNGLDLQSAGVHVETRFPSVASAPNGASRPVSGQRTPVSAQQLRQ